VRETEREREGERGRVKKREGGNINFILFALLH
jgi:hypothetical protein